MHFSWFDLICIPILMQGFFSLKSGITYLQYCHQSIQQSGLNKDTEPRVAILIPCKGIDSDLHLSLPILADLNYSNYELIFIIESEADDVFSVLKNFCKSYPKISKLLIAGFAKTSGQKVHNLLCGLNSIQDSVKILAFLDSDAIVSSNWLGDLVNSLDEDKVGATTGFRWYLPFGNSLVSLMLSAWNGSAATVLGPHSNNFAWGGSMAIKRSNFKKFKVEKFWEGSLSDDYSLKAAVKQSGHFIKFIPSCLLSASSNMSFRELLEFSTRQIIITRVYDFKTWQTILFWYSFYVTVFCSVGIRSLYLLISGRYALTQFIFITIYGLSFFKSFLTLKAIEEVLGKNKIGNIFHKLLYCLSGPLVAILYLYNLFVSCFTKQILWRGIRYHLCSPNKTIILKK